MLQFVADVTKLSVELILLGIPRFAQTSILYLLRHRKSVLISVLAPSTVYDIESAQVLAPGRE